MSHPTIPCSCARRPKAHALLVASLILVNGAFAQVFLSNVDQGAAVTITDPTTVSSFSVGRSSTGTLTVQGGGDLQVAGGGAGATDLGRFANGNGTLNINGAGSSVELETGYFVSVGDAGTGALNISDGGSFKVNGTVPTDDTPFQDALFFANQTGSHATLSISGANSTATISGNTVIGNQGTATATITNGGALIVDAAGEFLGIGDQGGAGMVTVDGPGSRLIVTNAVDMGHNGYGRLDVQNGGFFSSGVGLAVGNLLEPGSANLNIRSSGVVQLGVLSVENGLVTVDGGSLAVSVGTFVATGARLNFKTGSLSSDVVLNSGNISIDTQAGDVRTVYGDVTNNAAGYVHVLNESDGSLINASAGKIQLHLGDHAQVTFDGAVSNSGIFNVTQKTGTSGGAVFFNGTFFNDGTYMQDPTTSHFAQLVNSGLFTADVGDVVHVSGALINSGNLQLTGSFLSAGGGITNSGAISIFDSAVIGGDYTGAGSLVFHALGSTSHLTFSDFFFGNLEIVFDDGFVPPSDQAFGSFFGGATFTQLIIGGVNYGPMSFIGAAELLADGSLAPIVTGAVPEPSTYWMFGLLGTSALIGIKRAKKPRDFQSSR